MIGHGLVLREIACDAALNLQGLKGRTVLALIGIAIGTAAVIAMLHIGHNARNEAMRQFDTPWHRSREYHPEVRRTDGHPARCRT